MLGHRPRRAIHIKSDLDLWTNRIAMWGEGLGQLIARVEADEEGRAQGFEKRRLARFIRLDNDVEAVGKPLDHDGRAEFPEILHRDATNDEARSEEHTSELQSLMRIS